MQVLTGSSNNRCHVADGPGAYEWWYVDALSADGEWGVVLILFRGMPMSPTYLHDPSYMQAGCAVSVYHHGVRIAFSFSEQPLSQADFCTERVYVQMKGACIELTDDGFLTALADVPCDDDGRSVQVRLRGTASAVDAVECQPITENHAWILAQPRMRVTASVALRERASSIVEHHFETLGYHDHNCGYRSMHRDYGDWYWGRVHAEHRTIVVLSTPHSEDACSYVYEVDAHGSITAWQDVTFRYEKNAVTPMGLMCSKRIVITGTSPVDGEHEVVCVNDTTCEDSPFYQRYRSSWTLDGMPAGTGMSEYMNVARMKSAWIRPFLRLPLVNLASQVK